MATQATNLKIVADQMDFCCCNNYKIIISYFLVFQMKHDKFKQKSCFIAEKNFNSPNIKSCMKNNLSYFYPKP